MPDLKITELTALVSPSNDDLLPIVDDPAGTASNKKITVADLQAGLAVTGHHHDAAYQPLDSDLTAMAGLAPADNDVVQRKAGVWTNRTPTQLMADLGALGQIPFPAAQNASGDANTLDDYEEGSFTPVFTCDTPGNLSLVYTNQTGAYTKIGRVVFYQVQILTSTFTHSTASGNVLITGLPFTVGGVTAAAAGGCRFTRANYTMVAMRPLGTTTNARLWATGSGQGPAFLAIGDFPSGTQLDIVYTGYYVV